MVAAALDEPAGSMAMAVAARRIGRTKEIAEAIIDLLRNGFISGTVLHADGGHRLIWLWVGSLDARKSVQADQGRPKKSGVSQ